MFALSWYSVTSCGIATRDDIDIVTREQRAQEALNAFEPGDTEDPVRPAATETVAGSSGVVAQPGEVVVIHREPGEDYGRLAIRHKDGTRTLLNRRCLRVDISAGNGICLSQDEGDGSPRYTSTFFDATDPALRAIKSYGTPLPSRARVSADGSLATTTGFVDGTSYEDSTVEITTIVTIDSFDSTSPLIGLNQFNVEDSDPEYNGSDRKFWGVTFVDNEQFYVTGFFADVPLIVRGNISNRSMELTGLEGSCPSLSPDGETLVYKRTRDDDGFDLVAVELASGDSWTLGETRSVNDQVAWLDNETILYAIHPDGYESDGEESGRTARVRHLAAGRSLTIRSRRCSSPARTRQPLID